MESNYDKWADVYDLVYSYVKDDIGFFVKESKLCSGEILELGSGTGRITLPIAIAGCKITGIDFSSKMVALATQKASCVLPNSRNLTFLQKDMRDFDLQKKFSRIFIPFRGFQSLLSVEDQASTLKAIKKHLEPDGKLIFSVFVPDILMIAEGYIPLSHFRDVKDPITGETVSLWHEGQIDTYNQIMHIRLSGKSTYKKHKIIKDFDREFEIRYSFRWEIFHLLNRYGFKVEEIFGDFSSSPYDQDSTEMIWVAKAPIDC
ncbi:MAG: class I SAM-dependent methyltransferase [SAR202 cluster bacterium]|nr:class I SAM-dependent methyltransferase [SAR202 cluster bacterium]